MTQRQLPLCRKPLPLSPRAETHQTETDMAPKSEVSAPSLAHNAHRRPPRHPHVAPDARSQGVCSSVRFSIEHVLFLCAFKCSLNIQIAGGNTIRMSDFSVFFSIFTFCDCAPLVDFLTHNLSVTGEVELKTRFRFLSFLSTPPPSCPAIGTTPPNPTLF